MNFWNVLKNTSLVVFLCLPLVTCMTVSDGGHPFSNPLAKRPAFQTSLGPKLKCLIDEGSAQFSSGWYDFQPMRFDVVQGQSRNVTLYRAREINKAVFYVRFEENGQRLVFCPKKNTLDEGEKVNCTSVYALEDDLEYGIKRTLDVPDIIRGGALQCGYNAAGPKEG